MEMVVCEDEILHDLHTCRKLEIIARIPIGSHRMKYPGIFV